jgi:DNA primase
VQNFEKISFPLAVKKLAESVNFVDPRLQGIQQTVLIDEKLEPFFKCLEDTLAYYQFCLASQSGKEATAYLNQRGITPPLIETFKLGYALQDGATTIPYLIKRGHLRSTIESLGIQASNNPNYDRLAGRVIFPILNSEGRVVGFSGRILQDQAGQAKYVNSSESPIFSKGKILYHYHHIKLSAQKAGVVYVMEGFMDVIALHKAAIPNAVALMGTAFTSTHAQLLKRLNVEVRIALDQDKAGQEAMMKMIPSLNEAGMNYRFVVGLYPEKDADEILISQGEKGLVDHLNVVMNKIDFSLRYYQGQLSLDSTENRVTLIKRMVPLIASTPKLEQLDYLRRLGGLTGYTMQELQAMVKRLNEAKSSEAIFKVYRPEAEVVTRLKRAEKALLFNMLINQYAIDFYTKNLDHFIDQVYQKIAEFLVSLARGSPPIITDLITLIATSELTNKDQLIREITSVIEDKNVPKADDIYLKELLETIQYERKKIILNHKITTSIAGKSEPDKARIINQMKGQHHDDATKEKQDEETEETSSEESGSSEE